MRRVGSRAVMLAVCLAASGCSLQKGGPLISDRVWMLDKNLPPSDMGQNENFIPDACPQTDDKAATWPANQITQCVYAMLQLIDVKWVHFEDQLIASSSTSNFAADTTLLGLGAAGSFVTGGATQILHAVSAGVTGLRSSFNEDILYSQTITAILLQMEADRAAQRSIIMAKLTGQPTTGSNLNTMPYTNMYQAANDLFQYARAGSWSHALLSIQKSAAISPGNPPGAATPPAAPPPTH